MNPDEQWGQEAASYPMPDNGATFQYNEQYNENIPINGTQYTDYTNGATGDIGIGIGVTQSELGAVRNLTHIPGESDHHWPFVKRHLQQVKALTAGLLLLFGSGVHITWGIYQAIFYDPLNTLGIHLRRQEFEHVTYKDFGLIFTIVSWYAGVMAGSAIVGFFLVPNVGKKTLYNIAAALMLASSLCLIAIDEENWDLGILIGRFLAGISHGFIYVLLFVQASENSSKEFREMLVIFIGALLMFSIYISATGFLHMPILHLQKLAAHEVSDATSSGRIGILNLLLSIAAIVTNSMYTLESVPFLLKHQYKVEEGLYVISKLRNEPLESPAVLNDYAEMKAMYESDMAQFGCTKIFTKENRDALYHGIYGRIIGMLSSSVVSFVIIVRHLLHLFTPQVEIKELQHELYKMDRLVNETKNETLSLDYGLVGDVEQIAHNAKEESYDVGVFISYVILIAVVHGWFTFGFWATYLANRYNWRRDLYLWVNLFGFMLIAFTIIYLIGFLDKTFSAFAYLCSLIFLYVFSWPLNIFGHLFLTDGFPISLNAGSICVVSIAEHAAHIAIIAFYLNLKHSVGYITIVVGIIFTLLGYKLYRRTAYTKGLSLMEARVENQKVMLTQSFGNEGLLGKINMFF